MALFVAKVEHTLSEKIILNEVMLRESPTICATLKMMGDGKMKAEMGG